MPHCDARSVRSSLPRLLAAATAVVVIPGATAVAQTLPHVKVVREETAITSRRDGEGDPVMHASRDALLEVLHTEGDRYDHRPSNWYLVSLPPDAWGSRHSGWVSGRDVEFVPAIDRKTAAGARVAASPMGAVPASAGPLPAIAGEFSSPRETAVPAAPATPSSKAPEAAEVVLNFEFGKSDLTIDAKGKLAAAAAMLKATDQGASFALEGHADHIGSERFNDELGRRRAETVRRHLVDEHKVPAEKVGVISFGESKPAAPNDTDEGRAQNRRVVVRLGS